MAFPTVSWRHTELLAQMWWLLGRVQGVVHFCPSKSEGVRMRVGTTISRSVELRNEQHRNPCRGKQLLVREKS